MVIITVINVGSMSKEVETTKGQGETTSSLEFLPDILFPDLDGNYFNWQPDQYSTLVMFFDPDCSLCEDKIKEIQRYSEEFAKTRILLISPSLHTRLVEFSSHHKFGQFENLTVLQADYESFYNSFNTTKISTIFIFDPDGRKLVTIQDEVNIKTVIKYIRVANER